MLSKELLKRWVELNSEFIDNVEEMKEYIDGWSLGGDSCWDIERFEAYVRSNTYRMPPKVRAKKGQRCILPEVSDKDESVSVMTLYKLSDWQLINLYDYTM